MAYRRALAVLTRGPGGVMRGGLRAMSSDGSGDGSGDGERRRSEEALLKVKKNQWNSRVHKCRFAEADMMVMHPAGAYPRPPFSST